MEVTGGVEKAKGRFGPQGVVWQYPALQVPLHFSQSVSSVHLIPAHASVFLKVHFLLSHFMLQ